MGFLEQKDDTEGSATLKLEYYHDLLRRSNELERLKDFLATSKPCISSRRESDINFSYLGRKYTLLASGDDFNEELLNKYNELLKQYQNSMNESNRLKKELNQTAWRKLLNLFKK